MKPYPQGTVKDEYYGYRFPNTESIQQWLSIFDCKCIYPTHKMYSSALILASWDSLF